MQQPGAKHEIGGTYFKWGAGNHWLPPLATALECGQIYRCRFR